MLINWVTVAAQIVNFLILLYLLKRFLYGPIVAAMNQREERIRREMEETETARREVQQMQERLEAERAAVQEAREEMLEKARTEVEEWKQDALERGQQEIEENRKRWRHGLAAEREHAEQTLKENVARQVVAVSRKVIRDLADGSLEQSAVERFLERIDQQKNEDPGSFRTIDQVIAGLGKTFSQEHKVAMKKRLQEIFPESKEIEVESRPGLEFGIRLLAGDLRWDWNLISYMQNLENEIFAGLNLKGAGEAT